jgi:hypothetical protein
MGAATSSVAPAATTSNAYAADAAVELPELSVAVTVKEVGPGVVGIPLMSPVEAFMFKPAGRAPELTDQV